VRGLRLPAGENCGVDDFLIARNPDRDSKLPFLLRLPLGNGGFVLRARDTWPRTSAVYCHGGDVWPDDAEIVERVAVRVCSRRGAAIDLQLDRGRENRSMFVFTQARGREVIFWQSARTLKQSKPNVSVPTSRASGRVLQIVVDSHERYPWNFAPQQATTIRRALTVGDYAVEHEGRTVAVVERKSLADLVATMTGGKLSYVMAALAGVGHAALVVEERYSSVFKLTRVRPAVVAEGIAEAQIRFPNVPIIFTDTRLLAQEWTYRFFGAAVLHAAETAGADDRVRSLQSIQIEPRSPAPASGPSAAELRQWAKEQGIAVAPKGRLRPEILDAYLRGMQTH
jgi:ERCC4 domain